MPSLENQARTWMSPRANDAQPGSYTRDKGRAGAERPTLTGQAQQWATPSVPNGGRSIETAELIGRTAYHGDRKVQIDLRAQVMQWATPQGRDGDLRGADQGRFTRQRQKPHGPTLPEQVMAMQWPTPATDSFRSRSGDRIDEAGLGRTAQQWPTPSAAESRLGYQPRPEGKASQQGQQSLATVAKDWPTPAARDYRTPNTGESQDRRNAERARGQQLQNFVEHLRAEHLEYSPRALPSGTPGRIRSRDIRRLNPRFVDWLMGRPPGWSATGRTGCGLPATAWSRWLRLMRSALSWLLCAPTIEVPARPIRQAQPSSLPLFEVAAE
jgi:hypothetical protein